MLMHWATNDSWQGQAMDHILPSTEHLHVAEAAVAPWLAGKGLFQSNLPAWKVKCFIKTLLRTAGCFSTCLNNWWTSSWSSWWFCFNLGFYLHYTWLFVISSWIPSGREPHSRQSVPAGGSARLAPYSQKTRVCQREWLFRSLWKPL